MPGAWLGPALTNGAALSPGAAFAKPLSQLPVIVPSVPAPQIFPSMTVTTAVPRLGVPASARNCWLQTPGAWNNFIFPQHSSVQEQAAGGITLLSWYQTLLSAAAQRSAGMT